MPLGSPRGSAPINKGRKSTAKCIKSAMTTLVIAAIAAQILALLRYARTTEHNGSTSPSLATEQNGNDEFILWNKNETYMRDCELHYKGNETWGKLHAPYVDKIEAKAIMGRAVPSMRIVPTLAVFDKENITKEYSLEFMKSLKQPYVIKSTHVSGGVARVFDNKYHCFKYCINETVMPLGRDAFLYSREQWLADLYLDYSKMGAELQYKFITPRTIIEEDVISSGRTGTDVTFWWLAGGHPVFVSQQCEQPRGDMQGFQMKRIFVGTDFRKLPVVFNRGVCKKLPPKPESWDNQLEIMKQVGKSFPNEVVRVDVYAGGDEVWFSELTFTTAGCWRRFTPHLADGLLYGLMKGKISPQFATPENIERMLSDKSWVLLSIDEENGLSPTVKGAYPSPLDLCISIEEQAIPPNWTKLYFFQDCAKRNADYYQNKCIRDKLFDSCIEKARLLKDYPVRCIVSERNGAKIRAFGLDKASTDSANTAACEETALRMVGKRKRPR